MFNLNLDYIRKHQYQLLPFPTSWKELEEQVSHILSYCNYKTEVEKTITLARGSSEIDVYAVANDKYGSLCICECKYWNKFVNQDVVEAFRSRINDIGANIGIIISKKGFQSGCYEKIKYTNIKLFSYEEFISFFEKDYLLSRAKQLSKLSIPLHNYSNPMKTFYVDELEKKDKETQDKIEKLMIINDEFSMKVFSMGYYDNNPYFYFDNLLDFYLEKNIKFNSYEEVINYTIERIKNNLQKIDKLFGKPIRYDGDKEKIIDKVGI